MLSLFASIFLAVSSFAASPCTSEQIIDQGIVASRFLTTGLGCVVQITPKEKPDLRYREFWLDERGRFMVFVSVPGDDADKSTGTRSYFLFPRRNLPSFRLAAEGGVALRLGSGDDAIFSNASARLQSFPGSVFEDDQVNLGNFGGFEIQSFRGIRLDAGWMVGSQAYKNPNGNSILFDAHNTSCTIRNDEFFFYENMYYGEPNLRFPDDASLAEFLAKRCPKLDLTPLRSPAI